MRQLFNTLREQITTSFALAQLGESKIDPVWADTLATIESKAETLFLEAPVRPTEEPANTELVERLRAAVSNAEGSVRRLQALLGDEQAMRETAEGLAIELQEQLHLANADAATHLQLARSLERQLRAVAAPLVDGDDTPIRTVIEALRAGVLQPVTAPAEPVGYQPPRHAEPRVQCPTCEGLGTVLDGFDREWSEAAAREAAGLVDFDTTDPVEELQTHRVP